MIGSLPFLPPPLTTRLISKAKTFFLFKNFWVCLEKFLGLLATLQLIEEVKTYLTEHGEIDAQGFKEMTGLSRKFSIPILEYLDRVKITMRIEDRRCLRKQS